MEELRENAAAAAQVESVNKSALKNQVEAQVEQQSETGKQPTVQVVPLSFYQGQDADEIVRQLVARSDFENRTNLVVTNVIDNGDRYEGALTIVLNKALPQFVRNANTGLYELSTSKNLFTTRIQLAAILKNQGEMAMANTVRFAPVSVLLVLFENARISLLGHVLAAGEVFCNPFASRPAATPTVNEHDRYEYFPYELSMCRGMSLADKLMLAELTDKYSKMAEQ